MSYHSGVIPHNLFGADLNGDGAIDLVTAHTSDSTASVLLNNGNGTFKAPTSYANALRVRLADFNEDGVTDIATTSTNTVGLYLGNTRRTAIISGVDLTTQQSARTALSTLEERHKKVLSELGSIGASRQRLQTAMQNLSTARENFIAAESRIRDADIAQESANFLKSQILQQAAASIASSTSRAPEMVLSLLRQ